LRVSTARSEKISKKPPDFYIWFPGSSQKYGSIIKNLSY
jgi:hypothetical protein